MRTWATIVAGLAALGAVAYRISERIFTRAFVNLFGCQPSNWAGSER